MRYIALVTAFAILSVHSAQASKGNDMTGSDFVSTHYSEKWRAVNDGVMGGLSSGGPYFEDNNMVFEGVINTNGGGFSSVRLSIDSSQLATSSGLALRLKSDGRAYKLTLKTNMRYRSRHVSFQAEIPRTPGGTWSNIIVPFTDLRASIFGRPIIGAEFDKTQVREIGIILADGQNGAFRLDVGSIQPSPSP